MTEQEKPLRTARGRPISRWAVRIVALAIIVPLLLVVAVYLRLLFGPLPMTLLHEQARQTVLTALPPGYEIELGEIALALEGPVSPVVQVTPVTVIDRASGATIKMDALDLGFSPFRALIGQPGTSVTLVGPHIQMVQDLLGPRASTYELIEGEDGQPVIRVQQGEAEYPVIGILGRGIDVLADRPGGPEFQMRSDNELLISTFEAIETALASVIEQTRQGRFSRLTIRNGTLDLHDTVYSLFRQFTDINLRVAPTADGQAARAEFSARIGRFNTTGTIERRIGPGGEIEVDAHFDNLDFATIMPFLDDPGAMFAVQGGGILNAVVRFNGETGEVRRADFRADLNGLDFRVASDRFPLQASNVMVTWRPEVSEFELAPTPLRIGNTSAVVSGVFRSGLDPTYGPTLGISVRATEVYLRPGDLAQPTEPFDEIVFQGWSAPLYGATGIDRLVATKPGVTVSAEGRLDVLVYGTGLNATVTGTGASADDLKRLWPYFMSSEARSWFIDNVADGHTESSNMRFQFPVGSIGKPEDDLLILDDSVSIDLVGTGVRLALIVGMDPIPLAGNTRVEVHDNVTRVTVSGGELDVGEGPVAFANGAFIMESNPESSVIEISGDLSGTIPSLVAVASQQSPELLDSPDLSFDPADLYGDLSAQVVATVSLDGEGEVTGIDYGFNGFIEQFGSIEPIQTHSVEDGTLQFAATQNGYRITGDAVIDGMGTNLVLEGRLGGESDVRISSRIDAAELKELGIDITNYVSGMVEFVGRPLPDGEIQLAADLTDASVFIHDLGIEKAAGVAGTFNALIRQGEETTELTGVDLSFGEVNLQGSVTLGHETGLERAEFTQVAVSPGDSAQMLMERQDGGGYAITVRGEQLDLKPTLKRFFGLGEGTGGPQATQYDNRIAVDVELDRGLGFYRTTAYDLSMKLTINGTDLRDVLMTALLGGESRVSVTTNEGDGDTQTMSVAFNDAGTLLRLLGVYPRLLGGTGSLVLTSGLDDGDQGRFEISNFSIVDEDKVAEILGNHSDSREMIASGNRVSFENGQVEFTRHPDRIEVTRGILAGLLVGGTIQGNIYTEARQYDLTGTYVPFFGVNNIFQQLPILGIILGGREGGGLIGVTFAVRGNLDEPEFLVNPVSALLPGVFRLFMEFQQSNEPPAPQGEPGEP